MIQKFLKVAYHLDPNLLTMSAHTQIFDVNGAIDRLSLAGALWSYYVNFSPFHSIRVLLGASVPSVDNNFAGYPTINFDTPVKCAVSVMGLYNLPILLCHNATRVPHTRGGISQKSLEMSAMDGIEPVDTLRPGSLSTVSMSYISGGIAQFQGYCPHLLSWLCIWPYSNLPRRVAPLTINPI